MRVGPHVEVDKEPDGYRVTFRLTDGPHIRHAADRSQMARVIERVLPGYLTPALRRLVGDRKPEVQS